MLVNFKETHGDIWEASWSLSIGGEDTQFRSEGELIDIVTSEIIDSVVDRIAEIFLEPIIVRRPEVIEMGIIGLVRSTEFLGVLAYLSKLDLVDNRIWWKKITRIHRTDLRVPRTSHIPQIIPLQHRSPH